MQDKSLKHEIPDVVLMPYHISESALPTIIDSIYGYSDGKDRRRARREQERKNKKK